MDTKTWYSIPKKLKLHLKRDCVMLSRVNSNKIFRSNKMKRGNHCKMGRSVKYKLQT